MNNSYAILKFCNWKKKSDYWVFDNGPVSRSKATTCLCIGALEAAPPPKKKPNNNNKNNCKLFVMHQGTSQAGGLNHGYIYIIEVLVWSHTGKVSAKVFLPCKNARSKTSDNKEHIARNNASPHIARLILAFLGQKTMWNIACFGHLVHYLHDCSNPSLTSLEFDQAQYNMSNHPPHALQKSNHRPLHRDLSMVKKNHSKISHF